MRGSLLGKIQNSAGVEALRDSACLPSHGGSQRFKSSSAHQIFPHTYKLIRKSDLGQNTALATTGDQETWPRSLISSCALRARSLITSSSHISTQDNVQNTSALGGENSMARFEGGWVRFERRILFGDIGSNPNTLVVWSWCMGLANRFPSSARLSGKQVSVPVGSFVTGLSDFAEMTKLPRTTVRRSLDYLVHSGRIRQDIGTDGRLITVCNFERYANPEDECGTEAANDRHGTGTEAANDRTHNGQINNKQINKVSDAELFEARLRFDLESLFSRYPRHEKKGQALRLLAEKIKTQEDFDLWSRAIGNYAAHVSASEIEYRYVLTFPSFVEEWQDWRDWQAPKAQKPSKAATGIVER